jgi:hypothetical protein
MKPERERIREAINVGVEYGGIDGDHHKDWVIDQMLRALTSCPMVVKTATDSRGKEYTYTTQGESDQYKDMVAEACDGEDGPNTYPWDCGIAP